MSLRYRLEILLIDKATGLHIKNDIDLDEHTVDGDSRLMLKIALKELLRVKEKKDEVQK